VLVLSNEEIARLFSVEDCMAALEPMYRDLAEERALMSPRVDNIAPTAHPGGYYAFKHMGGTWPAQQIQALRINSDVVTHPVIAGKARRQKQPLAPGGRWVGLVLLFSTQTGALLAMFPDGVVQRLRVGAASGLALKHLARKDAATLALIGSGWQAGAQLAAALAARPLQEVRVWSPRKESRDAFVLESRKIHSSIVACDSVERCVDGADVIAASTSSMVRVIDPKWLKPGVHVSCIKTHEVDGEVLDRCSRVVLHNKKQAKQLDNVLKDTPNVSAERGKKGWWNDGSGRFEKYPDLCDLLSGGAEGRKNDKEITCFVNNVGTGLQFAAAGAWVLRRAREAGVGTELPDDWFSEDVHP